MKLIFALCAAVFVAFAPLPAAASALDDYELRPGVGRYFMGTPLYMFASLNLHEGSHAITALALGYDVESYRPWPHVAQIDGKKEFVGGAVRLRGKVVPADEAKIAIAPVVADAAVFFAADLALVWIDHGSAGAPVLLLACMLWPWSNFLSNTLIHVPGSDILKYHKATGSPEWKSYVLGGALTAVMAWRLAERSRDVLLVRREDDQRKSSAFSSPQPLMLTAGFSF